MLTQPEHLFLLAATFLGLITRQETSLFKDVTINDNADQNNRSTKKDRNSTAIGIGGRASLKLLMIIL